jgi:hypothetical protein
MFLSTRGGVKPKVARSDELGRSNVELVITLKEKALFVLSTDPFSLSAGGSARAIIDPELDLDLSFAK